MFFSFLFEVCFILYIIMVNDRCRRIDLFSFIRFYCQQSEIQLEPATTKAYVIIPPPDPEKGLGKVTCIAFHVGKCRILFVSDVIMPLLIVKGIIRFLDIKSTACNDIVFLIKIQMGPDQILIRNSVILEK